LKAVAKPDGNAVEDGGYIIRSLYFDNYSDKAVVDKLSGQSRREKFRLRYYNGDTSFIRLERKSKANRLAYKEDAIVTAEQCAAMLAGDYSCLKTPDIPLLME
jgi:SPX domain protein involved in polyphosphate accumulation